MSSLNELVSCRLPLSAQVAPHCERCRGFRVTVCPGPYTPVEKAAILSALNRAEVTIGALGMDCQTFLNELLEQVTGYKRHYRALPRPFGLELFVLWAAAQTNAEYEEEFKARVVEEIARGKAGFWHWRSPGFWRFCWALLVVGFVVDLARHLMGNAWGCP